MQYRADSLGLVGHVTSLLIDLIHEQLGLQYKASDADQIADRLAPLVLIRRETDIRLERVLVPQRLNREGNVSAVQRARRSTTAPAGPP